MPQHVMFWSFHWFNSLFTSAVIWQTDKFIQCTWGLHSINQIISAASVCMVYMLRVCVSACVVPLMLFTFLYSYLNAHLLRLLALLTSFVCTYARPHFVVASYLSLPLTLSFSPSLSLSLLLFFFYLSLLLLLSLSRVSLHAEMPWLASTHSNDILIFRHTHTH